MAGNLITNFLLERPGVFWIYKSMFPFFKNSGLPKDINSLSDKELDKLLAELPKQMEAKLNEDPVENRLL